MEHLLENSLIKDSQHGFLPGKSCATNLVEFMDVVSKAVDEGEAVVISTLYTYLYTCRMIPIGPGRALRGIARQVSSR